MKALWKRYKVYWIITFIFLVWMSFFDANAWFLTHRELSKELKNLTRQRDFFQKQIQANEDTLKRLNSKEELERYARETYFLNNPDTEETYIIQYDTI